MSVNGMRVTVEAVEVNGKWQARAFVVKDGDTHHRFEKSYNCSITDKLYATREQAIRAGNVEIERWQYKQP